MATVNVTTGAKSPLEPFDSSHHALVSWKSVIAGLFVAFMFEAILMSLGAAIGGLSASNIIENAKNGNGLALGIGVWAIVTVLIALFGGSYFAARISTFITGRVGAAQGLIIASLFFGFAIFGAGTAAGILGVGLGSAVGAIGNGASDLASSPVIQSTVEDALGDVNLKSDAPTVAKGLVSRLMRGDTESAKNYLAYQTGLPTQQVDQRLSELKIKFDDTVKNVGATTARAVGAAGWSAFFAMLLGLGAAVLGGSVGSKANLRVPLVTTEVDIAMMTARPLES